MSSFKSVKNLECLCFKNTSTSADGQGGVVKAKISAKASMKSTCAFGRGKISSIKKIGYEEVLYRVTPPPGTNIEIDDEGPVYRIFLPPTANYRRKPNFLDTFVIKDSTEGVEYHYKINEYKDVDVINGRTVRWIDLKFREAKRNPLKNSDPNTLSLFIMSAVLGGPAPSEICNISKGGSFQCIGELHYSSEGDPIIITERSFSVKVTDSQGSPNPLGLIGEGDIGSVLSAQAGLFAGISGVGEVTSGVMTAVYSLNQGVIGNGVLSPTHIDKFAGDFNDYKCVEKLYPNKDLSLDAGMQGFVDASGNTTNLFSQIDEGVFIGDDYHKHLGTASLVADDSGTWITPNSFHTEGLFQYKSELTNFHIRPDNTRFRIRASAPLANYESKIAPLYTIRNIKFSDPSGNLMVQYEDINILGDVDYTNADTFLNFATYSLKPKTNIFDQYDWQRRSEPHTQQISGYQLSFDVKVTPRDDAFDFGFDEGFEEDHIMHISHAGDDDYLSLDGAPLSTQTQTPFNPTKGIRISAIEICSSGGSWLSDLTAPRREDYFNLFLDVPSRGRRLEKKILPSFFALADADNKGVFPAVSSIWIHKNLPTNTALGNNLDECGSEQIVKALQSNSTLDYAELDTTGPHYDSGKMILKFSYGRGEVSEIIKGAFGCGFNQNTCPIWFNPSGAFNTETKVPAGFDDNYLEIESITLKIKAKKAVGSRDFVLDVVGWSDDNLLNVTKAPSGFLQNPPSVQINDHFYNSDGTHPVVSGFEEQDDDLSLAGRSLSEREKYFETSGNLGGDHYSLTTYPLVTSTEFVDYEIPLKVYQDDVEVGLSRNYNVSSMLENLFLDIYPIPSGAAIASAHLLVRFAPQVGMNLSVQGGECIGKIQDGRSEGKIFPTSRQSNDNILNAGTGYKPLSTIENIPHTYTTPSSIKTNYSRRWRGMEGTVQGPFDTDQFGFGFNNPLLEFPFLSGFYDFDYVEDNWVKSKPLGEGYGGVSGHFNITPEKHKNVGWRFKTQNIFSSKKPSHTSSYRTTDWTALTSTSPAHNFTDHELYGQIADAFNNVVRISGHNSNINFGDIDTSGGFSIFTRFTPDVDVSGASYDLFQSGVLFSKWSTPSDLDFALGYDDGYLCGYAKATDGTVVSVKDTVKYSGYQYPLSVILTYNDHESEKLKLYTDNELHEGAWATLRASSSAFAKHNASADLIVGHSSGSGVGMNMLLSEFAISTYASGVHGSGTNIVETNADATYRQVTAQKFLENHRVKFFEPDESNSNDSYKLWDYVNEDTYSDWSLGDFKSCEFSLAFSNWTKRSGKDLISFHLRSSGVPYEIQDGISLSSWPSTVSSGVSYHSQIENDFLRFHLSDTSDNFYSTAKRISKSLPHGYIFAEEALVVDTVINHRSSGDIEWPECRPTVFHVCKEHKHSHQDHYRGPRLVVSLYTKKKEPYWVPNEDNWGLINRAVHYIQPSSCTMKLSSKFDYQNLVDESEKWALFPEEPRLTEFTEKYYSQDVDDMFLQYDVIYPSGGPFDSNIDIHSAHVRLDDAFVNCTSSSGSMNLWTSGCKETLKASLDLVTWINDPTPEDASFNLVTGPNFVSESGLTMNVSGQFRHDTWPKGLNFRTVAVGIADSNWNPPGMSLHTIGRSNVSVTGSGRFNLVTKGKGVASVQLFPLSVANDGLIDTPSGQTLPLNIFPHSGVDGGIFTSMQLHLENNLKGGAVKDSGTIPVFILGSSPLVDFSPEAKMPLVIVNKQFVSSGTLSLSVYGDDGHTSQASSVAGTDSEGEIKKDSFGNAIKGMNLYIPNYGGVGSVYLRWFNKNYGVGIEQRDNAFSALDLDNEIRGVDLIGYGSCDSDSPKKAIDKALVTDETTWRLETCYDGGIFRAVDTYTNSGAINFAGEYGYSGNYYGFRKYTGLIPHAPYQSTLKITTGSTEPVKVPRDFEEWEYGTCGPNWRGGDQGDGDCDTDLVYSGVKLIGDYPYLSGDASITPPSGRNELDRYGERVAVTDDLMVVSSPSTHVRDEAGQAVQDAGSLFLYRRAEDTAGEKAAWTMEDKLMLPSGFRRDYVSEVVENVLKFDQFTISGQKWNIGQEGRKLGSSLDIGVSGDRETIIAGAPFAAWTRQFPQIKSSGIPTCMMVFVDKFSYNDGKIKGIANAGKRWEHLYRYFSAPWNAGSSDEFQPQLDVKILVFELSNQDDDKPKQPEKYKDFFRHHYISRMDDDDLIKNFGQRNVYNHMYSGIVDAFKEMFPTPTSFKPHSGIPPILGIFKEESHSTFYGGAYQIEDTNEDVIDDFISFYQDYSYASGVTNPEVPTAVSGHFRVDASTSEDWAQTTVNLINNTLDSGYLIETNITNTDFPVLSVITSGVGQKWAKSNADEFQIPPSSGGRVFIFEKESGKFNCVQEIIPFSERQVFDFDDGLGDYDDYLGGKEYNDRFGHSVAISKDTSIISVGSPFTYVPCEIFERQDKENTRMYNNVSGWLDYRKMASSLDRFHTLVGELGETEAQKQMYYELSQTDKFWLRTDENFWGDKGRIELYKPIFNYSYSDITSTGTWKFIADSFQSTSRLGYSTSISDNGDIVAFGAPTDSTNLFEDTNVWYTKTSSETFASYTNAGAVRIFESKKFTPHSGVVEFTRFGNLDRSVHSELREEGYYDRMPNYFRIGQGNQHPGVSYVKRLEFSDLEIPRDAGLAFIITPELDAASDEIIDNIKNWLALGDRTLVLVGNDPLWEEEALYRESNDVVNKVLNKLGSRMKILAADTEYESLQGCKTVSEVASDRWNVTKAFKPKYNFTETYDSTSASPNMFAKGVGKIVVDLSDLGLEDFLSLAPCDEINADVCNLPIKHLGDSRAQWNSECMGPGLPPKKIKYKTNLPFHFGNPNPGQGCKDYPESPKPMINRPYEDIVPILTAAEFLPDQYWFIPEREVCESGRDPIWEYYTVNRFETVCKFAEDHLEGIEISISGDGTDSAILGEFNDWTRTQNKGGFVDPEPLNGRDPVLHGVGDVQEDIKITYKTHVLSEESVLMVEEPYVYKDTDGNDVDNNNRVFILASTNGENKRSFTDGGNDPGNPGGNSDQNLVFFTNIVKKDCQEAGHVVQLGGWTKRTSFADAYEKSILAEKLSRFGFEVTENGTYGAGTDIDSVKSTDTVWIANANGVPTDADVSVLKNWLKGGNKNLVITYSAWDADNRQKYADNVSQICEKLGLKSRPFSRPCEGDYAVCDGFTTVKASNEQECCPYGPMEEVVQNVDESSDIFDGCDTGYGWKRNYSLKERTSVQKVSLRWESPQNFGSEMEQTQWDFIPISGGGDFKKLAWYDAKITDRCPVVHEKNTWYIEGNAAGEFDVEAGSGYRVFVEWVSETKNDIYPIEASISPVFEADCRPVDELTDGWERRFNIEDGNIENNEGGLQATDLGIPKSTHLDVRASKNGKLFINFNTDDIKLSAGGITNPKHDPEKYGLPQTVRVIGISGFKLPIETSIVNKPERKKRQIGWKYWKRCEIFPASSGVIPGEFRPIMHLSEEYCDPDAPPCDEDPKTCCPPRGENEIQDGPILAAEEQEHFTNGNDGFRRSKIVLLADSTMIQGQCPHYRNDAVGENQEFIRSLYPVSPHRRNSEELGFKLDVVTSDRHFQFSQKLRAPERGSAGKYYAARGINNTIPPLYGGGGTTNVDKYIDDEDTKHPADVYRPKNPDTPQRIKDEIEYFSSNVYPNYAMFPRFSGDFLNQGTYVVDETEKDFLIDAGREGGINELMKVDAGKDYLDFEFFTSGCPGDLFGYSVDLSNNKLVVGTPFNGFIAENVASGTSGIVQWHEIKNDIFRSGISVSQNGGAGAAFYFERTGSGETVVNEKLPWEFIQKIKPSSLNVGLDSCTVGHLQDAYGDHSLNSDFVIKNAGRGDKFGYSVAIDADMVAIGAPGHDFETLHDHIFSGTLVSNGLNTAFQRKSFNPEFDIPLHQYFDLGDSGNRNRFANSGSMVLNRGAVFNYRHSMTDWSAREKEWTYGEKLVAHGYHSNSGSIYTGDTLTASGNENDRFGTSVALFRSERGDSDYTLAVGAPFHDQPTSGNHISSGIRDAGAAFTYDAMLREQIPAIPNSGSWMDVKIFGAKTSDGKNMLFRRVYQNTEGSPETYYSSGIVFANEYGDLYIEASGFDPAIKGFVAHRPFVESVIGDFIGGESANGSLNLIASGKPVDISGAMNLMLSGAPSAYVYNNMNLRTFGTSGVESGNMPLFVSVTSGNSNQSLNLNVTSTQVTENLNLRLRGK